MSIIRCHTEPQFYLNYFVKPHSNLSGTGLDCARYIKVADLAGGFVATDLEAVDILNSRPIPELATLVLFGSGLLGLGVSRKKWRKK